MRNKYLKLVVSTLLAVSFIVCGALTAFAADDGKKITPTLEYDGTDFNFITTSKDVFLNFNHLVPGKTVSEDMKIVNGSAKETEYFIKVDYDDSFKVSKKDKELAKKLVDDLLIIRIEDEAGQLVYTGPVSANGSKDGIRIASLPANTEKLLKVFIIPSTDIGNEYMNFSVEIQWSFIIQQDDTPVIEIDDLTPLGPNPSGDEPITIPGDKVPLSGLMQLVNTADLANPVLWICVFAVAVIGAGIFIVLKKKKGKPGSDQVM